MSPTRLQCLHAQPVAVFLPIRPIPPARTTIPLLHTRPASHASQGRANKAAPGPGKRLGAKKAASELVVPGNIIFRQRGTHWFPGENCGMGRDHTIFALEKGYVTYYRDPSRHKERKYIGIVFERGMKLPQAPGAARRRRLGLVGRERRAEEEDTERRVEVGGLTSGDGEGKETVIRQVGKKKRARVPEASQMRLREGYQYRESNWSIGRAAERMGVKVQAYKRGDRFLAWRKLNERKARNAERRALSSRKKKGGAK